MKLPWRRSRDGKGKIREQDTSATTVLASQKSFLSVLRLKKFFGKTKRVIRQQKDQGFVKDFPGAGILSTSSLSNGSSSTESVILDSCYVSPPLEMGNDAVDVSKSENSPPSAKQSSLCKDIARYDPGGDASSFDTVIVRRKGSVLSSGVLLNASDSNSRSDNLCAGPFPDVETPWTIHSIDSDMPVILHAADTETKTEGGPFTYRAREGGKLSEYRCTARPSNREEHLVSVAEDATSKFGKQAKHADQIVSSSKERSYESFNDPIVFADDIAGQDNKDATRQSQSKDCGFASPWRQTNFSSPGRRFVEDLPLYGRPVLSVDRWETVNQVPHIKPGHARVLSGSTVVDPNGSQVGTSPSRPKTLQRDQHMSTHGQLVDGSKNEFKEDTEEDEALIGIDAISADVQWETILESRQTSHENEMSDLIEDHAAEIRELRDETTEQVRHVKHELNSALSANKQLKEKNAELRERRNRQAEQLQHKDKVLQQIHADHRGLQHRFEQCETHLLQQERTDAPGAKVTNNNASLERITALEAKVNEKGQLLRIAHNMNIGLAAALAKDKVEAEFYAEKVYELTGQLEDKPASDTEKDRLLEYKDKMYKDLDIRCSEVIETLQARVQDLEKEAELEKACSSGEITALQTKLERKTRANLDLEARKNAFKSVNRSVFDMLKRPQDNSRALKSMDEINRLVHADNDYLRGVSEAKEKEICDAEVEATQLRTAIREFREGEDEKARTISMLEESTRAQACELGRLQAEVEILPAQHEEALANKDLLISHYKQKAKISDQEKSTFISGGLDHWVRSSFRCKNQEISRLENEVGELRSASLQLRQELERMVAIRTQDALYAYVDEQESLLNKERMKAAEEEVRTLRNELSDLREYHERIRTDENEGIKEVVLKDSEELQQVHTKVDAESREEVSWLNARLEQGTIWAHAVKDLGGHLLARISELENTLQLHGIQIDDDQQDALIDRYNSLLDFVEDDEDEADAEREGQVGADVPGAEQILADFDDILVHSSTDCLRGFPADEETPADGEAGSLSAVAAGKSSETPNNRAQLIFAEKEPALGILFDSRGQMEFPAIIASLGTSRWRMEPLAKRRETHST